MTTENNTSNEIELLDSSILDKYKDKKVPWGFNGLGYIVYKRCVDIDTPILCGDLTWKKAGDLKVNDGIIGFDETSVYKSTNKTKNKYRYIRFGKVTHNKIENAECLGIELEDGSVLYSTPEHSWLVKFKGNSTLFWRETKDLEKTKYNNPVYLVRPFGKPWGADRTYEGGYLSASYDGEGNLSKTNEVSFTQTENSMLNKVESILKKKGMPFTKKIKSRSTTYKYKKERKDCFGLRTHGIKNVFRFLGIFKPQRLLDNFLIRCKKTTKKRFGKQMRCNPEDYVKVKRTFVAGKRKIAVLSTSIGTHFTGGFASHNTYSRPLENGKKEEWPDTILRCINGAQKIGADYTKEETERLFDHMYNLRCTFAGRMLWQLGTKTEGKLFGNKFLNCFFTTIQNINDFCFVFENLMLGGGVGFSVRREDIHELPKVRCDVTVVHENTKDADFIVPDSREGWVVLLKKVLKAYFINGKSFSYSTLLVRGAGEPIKQFGGTASGPQILVDGIKEICKVLQSREGKKIRSIDALDVNNIIGSIVVSGNLRRSAQIALGDPDDYLFLRAKRWDLGNIPNWRVHSNNTIYSDNYNHISKDIWSGYLGNGEPYGFFNVKLAQKVGRINDPKRDKGCGLNPCGEVILESASCCNLSEIFLNNITSQEQINDCAILLYKTQKAICSLDFIHEETTKIVHQTFRIGIGVTGICQSENKLKWLDPTYNKIVNFDKKWSTKKGWPESIRLTCVKPSGSLSLLAGSTPGIHPAFSKYYTRRIRMSSDDSLVKTCKDLGYHIENVTNFDGTIDHRTVIVEFPCCAGDNIITASEMSAIKQLELVKKLMTIWADNSVSVTVYYKKEELEDIKKWLKEYYKTSIKSVSFLLHKEHGFKQAPYVEITEEEYNKTISKIKPILEITDSSEELEVEECDKGACPIK